MPQPELTQSETKDVPVGAMFLSLSSSQLSYEDGDDAKKKRFSGVARTTEPMHHWYWGRFVHDFEGMATNRDVLALDWHHWDDIGIVDGWEVKGDQLTITGEVQSIKEDDQADVVINRSDLGTPYELSIDFTGPEPVLEFYPEGEPVTVNGKQLHGPLTVIRQWSLRRVALCTHGFDYSTSTKFSDDGDKTVSVTVLTLPTGKPMSKSTAATPPDDATKLTESETPKPGDSTPPGDESKLTRTDGKPDESDDDDESKMTKPDDDPARAAMLSELKQYTDAFGSEGATLFSGPNDFEACLLADHSRLKSVVTEKDAEIADLKKQFADLQLADDEPGHFSTPDSKTGDQSKSKFSQLGAAGPYAQSIADEQAAKAAS